MFILRTIWKLIPKTFLIGVGFIGLTLLLLSVLINFDRVSDGDCGRAGVADFADRSFRVFWCGKPVGFLFASEARYPSYFDKWPVRASKPNAIRPVVFGSR